MDSCVSLLETVSQRSPVQRRVDKRGTRRGSGEDSEKLIQQLAPQDVEGRGWAPLGA
jgi:hypothetical protein